MTSVPLVPFRTAALEPIRIDDRVPSPPAAWSLIWLIVPAWWIAVAVWCLR